MANWRFVFVDLTTDATPAALKPAQGFAQFIGDIGWGLAHEWADEWGAEGYAFRIASAPGDRQDGEVAINCRDSLPEAQGALAYHQVTGGVPDIEVGCDLFEDLFGTDGMQKGIDHEIKELLADSGANMTADLDDGSGTSQAYEACDLVQNTQYKAGTGSGAGYLSNFLLKRAFIPGAPGPWDYMGVMQGQNDVSNGYQILMSSPQPMAMRRRRMIQIRGLEAMPELVQKRKRLSRRMARRGSLLVPERMTGMRQPSPAPKKVAPQPPSEADIMRPPSQALQALRKLPKG